MKPIKLLDIGNCPDGRGATYYLYNEALVQFGDINLKIPYRYQQNEDDDGRLIGMQFDEVDFDSITDPEGDHFELSEEEEKVISEVIAKNLEG